MAGNLEQIELDLSGGLNVSDDPVRLPPGDLAVCDNAKFEGGSVKRKRHGHRRLDVWDPTVSGGGDLSAYGDLEWCYGHGYYSPAFPVLSAVSNKPGPIKGVASRDGDLVAWNGFRTLSRDEGADSWARHGSDVSVTVGGLPPPEPTLVCHAKETQVLGVAQEATLTDAARGRLRTCFAFVDPTDGYLQVTLQDNETRAYVVRNLQVFAGDVVDKFQVQYGTSASGAGYFFVTLLSNGMASIETVIVPELNPASFASYTVNGAAGTDQPFDSRPYREGVAVVFELAGALRFVYVKYDATAPVARYLSITTSPVATLSPVAVSVHPDGTLLVVWQSDFDAVKSLRARFYAPVTADAFHGEISVVANTGTLLERVACEHTYLNTSTATYQGCVAWSDADSAPIAYYTKFRQVSGATTLGSERKLAEAVLTHQAIRVGSIPMFVCAYVVGNTLQPSYVVVTGDRLDSATKPRAYPVACVARGIGTVTNSNVSGAVVRSAGTVTPNEVNAYEWSFLCPTARSALSDGSIAQKDYGHLLVDLNFDAPFRAVQAGKSLYIAGGVVQEYDGASVNPAGHLFYPEVTLTANNGAGSLTTSSTYTYRVYLVERTATGEFVRSAAITKTVDLAGLNDTVDIRFPPVPFNYRRNYVWEIYRSQANGTFLTLVAQVSPADVSTTYESARESYSTYVDVATDASIASNAADPSPATSQSGVGLLDPIAPPNCEIIAAGADRVWFAGGGLGSGVVGYSRLFDSGEAPTWNEALVQQIDRLSSPITGIGFMNDAVCVFKESRVYAFGGPGPDNLGGGGFDSTRTFSTEAGCVSPDSVVLTPYGLLFQSRSGIRGVNPGFQVIDVGGKIDPLTSPDEPLVAVATKGVARFQGQTYTLALDYGEPDRPRWAKYTYGARSSCIWQNNAVVAPTGMDGYQGVVWVEDETLYLDGGIWYKMDLDLGWTVPDNTGAWGRFKWWTLVGKYYSDHALAGTVRFDFQDQAYPWQWSPTEGTTSVDVSPENIGDSVQGWGGDYDDTGSPWYPGRTYSFRKSFKRQRAGSVRLRLWDIQPATTGGDLPSSPIGAAWGVSGITLRVRPRTENTMIRRGPSNFSRNG